MFKFRLIAVFTLISLMTFAQEKTSETIPLTKIEIIPQNDTIQLSKSKLLLNQLNKTKTPLMIMPNSKPKDSSKYSALKGRIRNDSVYTILNSVPKKERLAKK
ncbi:hypothetical protein [Halpernia sp.]|uniref:hypothetical protein n=1 Tax=Halpernia sp. TaxID=2782209 RepID=UPI003A93A911